MNITTPIPGADAGRQAFETIVAAFFGKPVREAFGDVMDPNFPGQFPIGSTGTAHPVFAFAHHFIANDNGNAGYTACWTRGDHQTIPVIGEDNHVYAIDTAFHKGEVIVELVSWPDAPKAAVESALALLDHWYTR